VIAFFLCRDHVNTQLQKEQGMKQEASSTKNVPCFTTSNVNMQRLTGAAGLATAVSTALASYPAESLLLVFDFDRTLTNGFSAPGDEANVAKVVRGGAMTVAALRQAHDAGAGLYIITARRPVRLSVEQLFASLDNAQSVLSPFFPRGDGPPVEFQSGGVPLACGGHIYAADYEKANALAHIVRERDQEGVRVLFFDDTVVNSFVVGTATAKHLEHKSEGRGTMAELISYWWDSFEEETGPSPTMGMSSFGTADSNYAPYLRHMLAAYGISSAECDARIEVYCRKGNARHGLQRSKKSSAPVDRASVDAAAKASRIQMSKLAEVLGARFARGPSPPSFTSHTAFEADKVQHVSNLYETTKTVKVSTASGEGWKVKAARGKARAKAAVSLFEGHEAASLPSGLLSAPRWETAFQIDYPSAGTTGGLSFIATLAGTFAVKSANNLAEEWFGNRFQQAAGVPVPDVRVVFPNEAEYVEILRAVEEVAKQYSRRGDAEGATNIMVHVFCAMRKYNGPLLLMELVPAALTLNELGPERTNLLLEPTVATTRAHSRLEAIGRVWVVDAVLNFRDRFSSRLSHSKYDAAVAFTEGRGPNVFGEENSPEQMRNFVTGNCDNFLLTDVPFDECDGSPVARAGAAAIDSHVKLIRCATSDTPSLAKHREAAAETLRSELGALLAEALSGASPSQSIGWLRFTIDAVSGGHVLSDDALAAVRTGAIRGIASVPNAVVWARSELAKARDGAVGTHSWREALASIDEEALDAVGRSFEKLLSEHADTVRDLPPQSTQPSAVVSVEDTNIFATDDILLAEAKLIGAHPWLWTSLGQALRKTLLDERVRGVPAGPHSMEWPGW
jgi:hypothetical protein